MTRHLRRASVLGLALTAAACSDPYATPPHRSPTATVREGELPGRIPNREHDALARPARPLAGTPRTALRHYAELVTNWRAGQLAARYRQASAVAVGQARRDDQQTAASAATDPELDHTTSRSQVVAVAPQENGWALVITREQTTPATGGLRYRLYRAHTTRVAGGFAVDRWEPQP